MAECIKNKRSYVSGGVNTSNNATFRLCDLKSNLMFLLRRIKEYCHVMTNKPLCHPELVSGSQGHEILKQVQNDKVFSIPSYRANEVRCGIFKNLKKSFAFTLAETLIVMGIIGVVAALTIPNLNSSTADKEKIAKVKKIHSNLEDAIGRATAVYGPIDEWFVGIDSSNTQAINEKYADRVIDFLKTSKTCKGDDQVGCIPLGNVYKNLEGTNIKVAGEDDVRVLLADGAALSLSIGTPDCSRSFYSTDIALSRTCGLVDLDIDGPKGPNTAGKDYFQFFVTRDGIVPRGSQGSNENITDCFKLGSKCTAWVIDNGNMDYLKADRTGKCPNGKTLNWTTNTSCK